jgi:hypothetical protein
LPVFALVFALCSVSCIYSQSFSSGSTGADGALTLTTPGVIKFDPKSFTPPLNPAGDNVFNFTTITIASGVVLKLSGRTFSTPIYFLATGPVKIDGGIDITGENGHPATNIASERVPSAPGPGGYPGGVGGSAPGTPTPPMQGSGPGGGAPGSPGVAASNGTFTGSTYLIPLLGGSGGGGGGSPTSCGAPTYAGGGGAGGGAIVIASSVSITLSSTLGTDGIFANSGAGGCTAGHGSGGAIRLVAPVISGATEVQTDQVGPPGLIRVEAFQRSLGCCTRGPIVFSLPFRVLTPATQSQPSIQVTTINGVPVNANPFSFPDLTINASSPVTVIVAAQNIPVGTVPKILVYSEFGPDQTVACSALQGTLLASTCSASITFPTGGTRGFVKANW